MYNKQHPVAPLAPISSKEEVVSKTYDAIIVGSGISAAILSYELTAKNHRVLILEAGLGHDLSEHGFERHLENFYASTTKDNNSPFALNPNADMPRDPSLRKLEDGEYNSNAYWVQFGPFVSDSVYARALGGTTLHWEGKTIRMLREDFKLKTNFKQGLDWPIELDELIPYYEKAEFFLGVSGDVEAQKKVGVEFRDNYVYPMTELRPSYLDQIVAEGLRGMQEDIDGEKINVDLVTFPQAKNSSPNPNYGKNIDLPFLTDDRLPFRPVGAISTHQNNEGERCQGNTACVPICPVQARFDARKLLVKAFNTGFADILTQTVASRISMDENGLITGIEVKHYESCDSPSHTTFEVKGKLFILAANAVENARLMLASAKLNDRKLNKFIGLYLMDHPYLLCWGLLPKNAGVGRGPICTSGICTFRKGKFREKFASFAGDIHNDGWGWATGSPTDDLNKAIKEGFFGRDLRQHLINIIPRQLLLAYMIEMPANPESRVAVDETFIDAIGNMRPIITFGLSDYSLRTAEYVYGLSERIFNRFGKKLNRTHYSTEDYGYFEYNKRGYRLRGGNHLSGTHIMGTDPCNSVVNSDQKSWNHKNLYLVGAGSMPSIGSSNTTLTVAALCFKTAEAVLKELEKDKPIGEVPKKNNVQLN